MHPLDRPVWDSLAGSHRTLSIGGDLARRSTPDVNLFAAARDDSAEALAALANLVPPGGTLYLAQAAGIVAPTGVSLQVRTARQLVASQPIAAPPEAFLTLGAADAGDMLALAQLTEPGPFLPRTYTMGRFIGVRIEGRLAAMAGERFRPAGHTEVSGVCTHPDFRGRGLARRLSAAVAARIQARGESPFLHAWDTNRAAITLYEALGFRWRADMQVGILTR